MGSDSCCRFSRSVSRDILVVQVSGRGGSAPVILRFVSQPSASEICRSRRPEMREQGLLLLMTVPPMPRRHNEKTQPAQPADRFRFGLYLNGVLQESRTASYDGIVASGMSSSSSYAQVHWSVDVANAFCGAGAIRYETDVRFYRNGSIEVVGYRRQAPVHEIYGRWNNTGTDFFRTITRLPNNGFNCLDEIQCQLETINRSVQY